MQTLVRRCSAVTVTTALVILTLLATLPPHARAQRQMVDRVVAIVDDESILLSEVLQEMNLIRMQRNIGQMSQADQEKLFHSVLESMIDDQLIVAQARAKDIQVTDDEVRDAVDDELRRIKENLGGEEKYRAELQRQGLTEADLRDLHMDQKRKQILGARLIQAEIRRNINISDDEVRQFFESKPDSIPKDLVQSPATVRLAHILIAPRPDPAQVAAARAGIETAKKRIEAGEDFATVAKEVSQWPTAASGGYLGSFRYGDFGSDAFDEAVAKLEPGEASDIIETRFGLQIVKLESRKGDEMTGRHIVFKLEADEDAQVRALDLAQSLLQRAQAGEDFQELARTYSDDTNTRDNGGIVDQELPVSDLVPEFRAAIDSVPVGGVSKVVQSQNGFHFFKVLARSDAHTVSFDEIREPLRRYLEQVEVEKRYRDYLVKLHEKFVVDIKV